ncbi:actin-like protein ARP6 [Guyanagaster necrorhizus]|uniref:Actin-like protein ARP6 n=1 Tax=Guyanagaster necrorhizus TaxID=856835 RepID=A0A9P8AS53_9AGAR|nr:actin-like protein ARP6 [Guyanagaster necrorhizus MCA 3950]KAG7445611.1 actin-like protein ARP6 [Guyanagaster necrorhizus MCA 3950]
MTPTIVLDNGGHTIKAGIGGTDTPAQLIPNAIARSKSKSTTYFGHELLQCTDHASLSYRLPISKGLIVDWDAQKAIWDGLFSTDVLGIDTTQSSLLLTEPYHNLPNIQQVYDQFIFEEYQFASYYRCTPASLIPHLFPTTTTTTTPSPDCTLIVDSGFSFTHAVPLIHGRPHSRALTRLSIGGKLLTNHLKHLISFRQWNMMDQTHITNHIKESCCFVSSDFARDLHTARSARSPNPLTQEYALAEGRLRQPGDSTSSGSSQILVMNNERFSVPEIIFRPDDIGLNQVGLAGTIAHSISLLPEDLQGMFWANIALIGGNTKFPGFRERLLADLRPLAPVEHDVQVYEYPDPITAPYDAAMRFVSTPAYKDSVVTRQEYLESGSNATRRKWRVSAGEEKEKEKEKEKQGRSKSKTGTARKK